MKKAPLFWMCCLLFLAGGLSVCAQETTEDAFLQMLRQEMKTQYDSLQNTSHPPYYIAYRVTQSKRHQVSANFGKIYENSTQKSAFLTVEVRIGDSKMDNLHGFDYQNTATRIIPLPLDDNAQLLRKILRDETRKTVQEAALTSVENRLRAKLLDPDDERERFSFLHGDRDGIYQTPAQNVHLNDELWERTLRYCTLYDDIELTEKSASVWYQVTRKYLVTSDNTDFVQNNFSSMVTLRVEGLTADNIPEHIERQYYARVPELLPNEDVLQTEMAEMVSLLSNMLHADRCQPVRCPVLFSPEASSVLIHNIIGHDFENPGNGIFQNRIGQKVMPEAFSIESRPNDSNLGGYYLFDDEGIKSDNIPLVRKGELSEFLSGRTQRPLAYTSNGHARGNRRLPVPRQANLVMETDKPLNNSQLFEKLGMEAQNQSLEYALYVKEVDVRCDTNGVVSVYPTVCYKVYSDGRKAKEEVRDLRLSESKHQWIRNLIAAGDKTGSAAIVCHSEDDDLLTGASAPALLFRNINVQPVSKSTKLRIVKVMDGEGSVTPMNLSELLQKSAQYEWDVDVTRLKIAEEATPYYEEFLMTDTRTFTVEASEGSLFYANEKPVRRLVPRLLLGSNLFNNEHLTDAVEPPVSYPLPFDDRLTFAKDFRVAADQEYQKALVQWKTKQALLPSAESRKQYLPDRSEIPSTQTYDEKSFDYPSLNNLEHLACELSEKLAKHDFLSRSSVHIYVWMGNVCFWNSEKTFYARPVSVIGVQFCGTVDRGGREHSYRKTIFLPSSDSLFSIRYLETEASQWVTALQTLKNEGKEMAEYYSGPLLVEGDAVGQMLRSALLERNPNLLAHREPVCFGKVRTPDFEDLLNQMVTSKKITITANRVGDSFDKSAFCRHDKIDAEGVETQETEIVRNGELISLLGNRNVTKSMAYSNGFQQLAFHQEACFATRGVSRLDFEHTTNVPHAKLKQLLIKEAKKQGLSHAYILRQMADWSDAGDQVGCVSTVGLWQLYRVDVRTGRETPVIGATSVPFHFSMLEDILCVSDMDVAFPLMTAVAGAAGTRDFPFAGVPTCIVAPKGLLLKRSNIGF